MDTSNLTSEISIGSPNLLDDSQELAKRFILTGVEQLVIAFPSDVVADISIIERSQILALPFYDPAIFGIIHRSGQIVPLVSLRQIFGVSTGLMAERLTVVRLNPAVGGLGGVGLIVDTTLGTSSDRELPSDLFTSNFSTEPHASKSKMRLFRPEMLSDRLWRSLRW
jgi:CheW-like domain